MPSARARRPKSSQSSQSSQASQASQARPKTDQPHRVSRGARAQRAKRRARHPAPFHRPQKRRPARAFASPGPPLHKYRGQPTRDLQRARIGGCRGEVRAAPDDLPNRQSSTARELPLARRGSGRAELSLIQGVSGDSVHRVPPRKAQPGETKPKPEPPKAMASKPTPRHAPGGRSGGLPVAQRRSPQREDAEERGGSPRLGGRPAESTRPKGAPKPLQS